MSESLLAMLPLAAFLPVIVGHNDDVSIEEFPDLREFSLPVAGFSFVNQLSP